MTHSIANAFDVTGRQHVLGDVRTVFLDITISSYTGSGETITAGECGLNSIKRMVCEFAAGHTCRWDGSKIRCYVITTGVEATGTANIGAVPVIVFGY